jgi:hypothetical protein
VLSRPPATWISVAELCETLGIVTREPAPDDTEYIFVMWLLSPLPDDAVVYFHYTNAARWFTQIAWVNPDKFR